MSTKFLNPGWRMPKNANQSKQSNYSMDFDGSQYISCGDVPLEGVYTISFWINPAPLSSGLYFLFDKGDGGSDISARVSQSNNNTVRFQIGSTNFPSTDTLTNNSWNNVILIANGSSSKIYINNGTATTGTLATAPNTTQSFFIGTDNAQQSAYFFNGKITEVSIFDYALSQSQVTTLYGTGSAIGNPMALPSTPIAYYPLGTSAWNGQYLSENNAIGDYVFSLAQANTVSVLDNFFNSSNFPDGFTASVWVKNWAITGTGNSPQNIFFNGANATNRFELYSSYSSESAWKVWLNVNSTPLYSNSLNTLHWSDNTKWVNLVVTWDRANGTLVLYSNGEAGTINTSAPTSWGASNTNTTRFGNDANQAGAVLTSNYQMWTQALSASEVETLYNYGSPIQTLANIPQSSNLKLWYKLDASEIYNSSSTEWEISDATAVIKTTSLQNAPSSERLQASNVITNGSTAMSFSAWIYYPSSFGSSKYLRICNAAQLMYLGNFLNNYVAFKNGAGFQAGFNSQIVPGQWNHITVSTEYIGSTWTSKLRLNGGAVDTQTGSGNSSINISSNNLDVTAWGYVNYSGSVLTSNSIVWDNKALTDSELLDVYNAFSVSNGVPTVQPSSISSFPQSASISGWYKLDGKRLDSSGNNNNPFGSVATGGIPLLGPGVSNANGQSSGMSQTNLVQSDLQTVAPYSKYAMNFDGTGDYIDTNFRLGSGTACSLSGWFYITNYTNYGGLIVDSTGSGDQTRFTLSQGSGTAGNLAIYVGSGAGNWNNETISLPSAGQWFHLCGTISGTTVKIYINNYLVNTFTSTLSYIGNNQHNYFIGGPWSANDLNGIASNVSIWNYELNSSQVREIYNEGLSGNLHNFSGAAPAAWWQLGENSSYVGGWTFADEIGTSNATGNGLPEIALTNGVGTTANGTSTGMSEGSLVGDAPYSTANAVSSGMAVTARGTNVP